MATIKELRKKQGLSREELAMKLGLAASTVGNYENGYRLPSLPIAKRIADIFGVGLDDIDFFWPRKTRIALKKRDNDAA